MGPDSRATLGPHPKSFPSHCSPPPPKDQALLSPSASCCHSPHCHAKSLLPSRNPQNFLLFPT